MATNTNPARGMRDFLPVDVRRREYVIKIIKEVYESYGFEPLETPAVENLETLMGKYGEEGNQLIFKILKRGEHEKTGEADLALRYDLTVPLARVVANNKNELPKFFKRYQIQPVWRADRPARGRFREFYQCDVDAIGSKSMIVEAELCLAVSEILQRLGFKDFIIRLNHRKVLTGILARAGVSLEKQTDALVALDKLDKIGREGVEKEFITRGIKDESGYKLLNLFESVVEDELKKVMDEPSSQRFIEIQRYFAEVSEKRNLFPGNDFANYINNFGMLATLKGFISDNQTGQEGFAELETLIRLFPWQILQHIKVDSSLARGLSYYTGSIFEISVPDLAGSLGGGGRYDGLIGMFGKEEIPACGFSLGLERILVVMSERGMFPPELNTNAADVLVTVWNEETIGESLALANELRGQGLRVFVYPEADKLGKQFKYAGSINVPFVAILGDEERAGGKVALKNMQTGEQKTISREEIAQLIKS
jgi:histidyl-tRNA synthetase